MQRLKKLFACGGAAMELKPAPALSVDAPQRTVPTPLNHGPSVHANVQSIEQLLAGVSTPFGAGDLRLLDQDVLEQHDFIKSQVAVLYHDGPPMHEMDPSAAMDDFHVEDLLCCYANKATLEFSFSANTADFTSRIQAQLQQQPGLSLLFESLVRHCWEGSPSTVKQFLPSLAPRNLVRLRTSRCSPSSSLSPGSSAKTPCPNGLTLHSTFIMMEVAVCLVAPPHLRGGVRPALFLCYSPAVEQSRAALAAQLIRDYTTLGHMPSLVTIFSRAGEVMHQNGKSIAYMGCVQGKRLSRYDLYEDGHPLRRLFQLDLKAFDDMVESLEEGQAWQGRVKMPTSINLGQPSKPTNETRNSAQCSMAFIRLGSTSPQQGAGDSTSLFADVPFLPDLASLKQVASSPGHFEQVAAEPQQSSPRMARPEERRRSVRLDVPDEAPALSRFGQDNERTAKLSKSPSSLFTKQSAPIPIRPGSWEEEEAIQASAAGDEGIPDPGQSVDDSRDIPNSQQGQLKAVRPGCVQEDLPMDEGEADRDSVNNMMQAPPTPMSHKQGGSRLRMSYSSTTTSKVQASSPSQFDLMAHAAAVQAKTQGARKPGSSSLDYTQPNRAPSGEEAGSNDELMSVRVSPSFINARPGVRKTVRRASCSQLGLSAVSRAMRMANDRREARQSEGVSDLLPSVNVQPSLVTQPTARAELKERWFDVEASGFADPVTGEEVILLVQTDMTEVVHAEHQTQRILDAEHALLEQVFPKHVLEVFAIDRAQEPGCATTHMVTAANTTSLARAHKSVTLLFADIVSFTSMCRAVEATTVMMFLYHLFNQFDALAGRHDVYKVTTVGDCYIVAGGLVKEDMEGGLMVVDEEYVDEYAGAKVMAFALDMLKVTAQCKMPHTGEPVQVRIGIHTGPVVSGVIGSRMPRFDLFGDTINTCSRMESNSQPGRIHVSAAAKAAIGDPPPRGKWVPTGGIQVKGLGLMETYFYEPTSRLRKSIVEY